MHHVSHSTWLYMSGAQHIIKLKVMNRGNAQTEKMQFDKSFYMKPRSCFEQVERWDGDKQVVANVWTGQSPSASSLTCDSRASDQKRQKSISQMDTAGLSRASLSLIFLGLHKPILRVSRGNDMKSTPWEMALINRLVSTVDSTH